MKISVLDVHRAIEVNHLAEITSHYLFSNKKMIYHPEGILSSEIFGISKADRRSTFAYINLHRMFIHPHIYANVLIPIYRNIIYLVYGQKRFKVEHGLLQEDPNGWTGLEELYNHWDEIDWSKSKSVNKINKSLLVNLPKDMIFIDCILVCPPAYRDVTIAGTIDASDHVDPLNNLYVKLLRSVSLLEEGGLFAKRQYATQAKIEECMVEINNYFKKLIAGKTGLIRKNLMGKSVDYGVRAVISAPTYNHERFEDAMVDISHTAVPIELACSMFYPFIEAWIKNFFTREVVNEPNQFTYLDMEKKKPIQAVLKNPDMQFSEKNIRKMINDYIFNPDNRFRVIGIEATMQTENGPKDIKCGLVLKGKEILPNNVQKELNRVMTVTDLLYLACTDVCEANRHVMVSRYPVGTDKGIFFNNIRIQSTIKKTHVIFNGKDYPNYPVIDFDLPTSMVGVQFIDTIVMSNSHCDGMGEHLSAPM